MRITLGILLLTAAFLLGMLEIVALVDPASTSLAGRFGPAPSWPEHAFWIAAVVAMGWVAVRLLRPRDAPPRHGFR